MRKRKMRNLIAREERNENRQGQEIKKERQNRGTKWYHNCDQLRQWGIMQQMVEYIRDEDTRSVVYT